MSSRLCFILDRPSQSPAPPRAASTRALGAARLLTGTMCVVLPYPPVVRLAFLTSLQPNEGIQTSDQTFGDKNNAALVVRLMLALSDYVLTAWIDVVAYQESRSGRPWIQV